jgi:hypothetical protein
LLGAGVFVVMLMLALISVMLIKLLLSIAS